MLLGNKPESTAECYSTWMKLTDCAGEGSQAYNCDQGRTVLLSGEKSAECFSGGEVTGKRHKATLQDTGNAPDLNVLGGHPGIHQCAFKNAWSCTLTISTLDCKLYLIKEIQQQNVPMIVPGQRSTTGPK